MQTSDEMKFSELSTKCRICLISDGNLVDIFGNDGKCGKIWVAVMECGSVQVSADDRLPRYICTGCLEKLRGAHEFRTLCMLSDQTLRQYIDFLTTSTFRQPQQVIVQNAEKPDVTNADLNYVSLVNEIVELAPAYVVHDDPPVAELNKTSQRKRTVEKRLGRSYEPNLTGKFSCRVCNKRFDTDRQLTRHESVSHGERRHACTTCGKRFTERGVLKAHVAALHAPPGSGRPFRCPFCDKAYVAMAHLRVHVRAAHTRERPHVCSVCGKRFAQRSVLRDHAASHAGHRPHACDRCDARFIRAAHLRRHVDVIHKENRGAKSKASGGDRPHACSTCGKRFARREHLARHSSVHGGERAYSCGLCEKKFARKWDVKRHMATHRDGKIVVLVPPTVAHAALQRLGTAQLEI